ncbi:MAG: zinc-dependent metalloprotease [Bacteroidota bacterium]
MKSYILRLFGVAMILLQFPYFSTAQSSFATQKWREAVERRQQNGTFQGFQCFDDHSDASERAKNASSCDAANAGYGTASWTPNSSPETNNFDPACTVPPIPFECNGGKYRIALRNIIFECADWEGDNYLESGMGFSAMPDEDLTLKLAQVNEYFANANLEIVEVERVRINDCDMYDFYWKKWGKDPYNAFSDGEADDRQLPQFDEPNVINLYWVGGFNGNHGCCGILGYVDKPPSERDFGVMRYGVSVNDSYLHHELSHYFGIYHTHWNLEEYSNVKGMPDGALDNSTCLTTGDGICDTWPDPNFEAKCENCAGRDSKHCYKDDACGFDMEAFACEQGMSLEINPNDGVLIDEYTSTVLRQNFTTYNNHDCRSTFTPCQYFKMNTVATSCRSHLKISNPDFYFESKSDYHKEIALGDDIPTFEAGKTYITFDGGSYDLSCFDWFLNEDDFAEEAVAQSTDSFNPRDYVEGVGTYTFYLAEVNALNNPPAKIPVTLVVSESSDDNADDDTDNNTNDDDDDTGNDTDDNNDNGSDDTNDDTDDTNDDTDDDTSTGDNCEHPRAGNLAGLDYYELSGQKDLLLETTEAFLGEDEELAWWITQNEPINDVIQSQEELDNALLDVSYNPANDGSNITDNTIYSSSALADGLKTDCSILEEGVMYYATPFVVKVNEQVTLTNSDCNGDFQYSSQRLGSGEQIALATMRKASLPCVEEEENYQLRVEVNGYQAAEKDFRLYVVAQTNTRVKAAVREGKDGIYTFTKADLGDYNPNSQGLRVAVFEAGGNAGSDVELAVTLTTGTSDETSLILEADYSNCLFGQTVAFECQILEESQVEGRNQLITNSLELYPSPTYDDFVHLNYTSRQTNQAIIAIYNLNGQIQKRQVWQVAQGENQLTLNLKGFASGIYWLQLMDGEEMQQVKFGVIR